MREKILYFFLACATITVTNNEVLFMSTTAIQNAMYNAEASINMVALYASDLCKELCAELLKREIQL